MSGNALLNREAWLNEIGAKLTPVIEEAAGLVYGDKRKMPKWTATVGFPSRGALSLKKRVIGQCWPGMKGKDGGHQLFISPVIHENIEVVATMAHEMVHAIDNCEHHHKGPFVRMVKAIGLIGKPTATEAGPEFIELIKPFIKEVKKFPHTPIVANPKFKAQTTRLLKVNCEQCGYVVRVTKKWVEEAGTPICPTDKVPMKAPGLILTLAGLEDEGENDD
jgi:hypothetical protein